MNWLPKKWKFNEIGSLASITGTVLSVVALVLTIRPELLDKLKKK